MGILLTKWITIANHNQGEKLVEELVGQLEEKEKGHLYEWLMRLERTEDFKGNQKKLADTTSRILEGLLESAEFRNTFFAQVESNNTACQDRAAMAYNEIYLSYCLYVKSEGISDKDKISLMVRGAKTQALIKALADKISLHERETGKVEHESVEIYLYYLIKLGKPHNLLVAIENMAYSSIGERDWISEKVLTNSINAMMLKELISFPAFTDHVKQYDKARQALETLDAKAQNSLDELDPKELSDQGYREQAEEIMHEKKKQESKLLKKWARNLIT